MLGKSSRLSHRGWFARRCLDAQRAATGPQSRRGADTDEHKGKVPKEGCSGRTPPPPAAPKGRGCTWLSSGRKLAAAINLPFRNLPKERLTFLKKTEGHGPPESSLNQPVLWELLKKTPSQADWAPESGRLGRLVPMGKPGRLGTPLPAPALPGASVGFTGHTVLGLQSKESQQEGKKGAICHQQP